MSSDEEDSDCPLCMEELDIADRNFRPCPCGYQICRFCWHHIKTNLNGRCPACRRLYSDQIVEFVPVSAEEIMRLKKEKKEKDRQTRDMRDPSRRQLSNIRVVQKNLVYVLGLSSKHASVENEFFKKYGRIEKVVISKRSAPSTGSSSSVGIYVTFARKEDAGRAIEGINGMEVDGKTVRASYGTTKYCTYYLRHMSCPNPNCMYLHEPGDDVDSYSKDTVAIGKHANTASTSTTTSAYPNKRPATAAKPTTATATIAPTATPESKPATAPRTWAPIPKVVPIPPVVIPKEEPTTPPPPSPPFQEIKSSSSTKHSKPTASSSSSTSTTKLNATPKVHKKPAPTEKHTKKLTIPLVPEEDEKPALPATASWAKTQPVVNHENVITPANFGPSLSDALNAPQKPKHSPSLKVKKEKKSKGKMVRLEEFEEAEREAKMAASRPKVVPKPEVAPIISPVVAPSVTPATVSAVPKSPSPVKAESAIPETKQAEKSNAESKLVSEERKEQDQSSSSGEKEKELQKVSSEDIVETPVSDEAMPEMLEVKNSNAVQPSKEQSQLQKEDIPVELEQPTPQPDAEDDAVTAKEEETPQNQPPMEAQEEALIEENGEKMENLASLNDTIIKAFDDAAAAAADESSEKVQSDETSQQPQDAVTDATQPEMDEQKLAQNISSPLAAMDRLSALVQQEIMVDSPEQPSFDAVQQSQQPMHQPQPQQPHPGMNRFDLGMPMQPDNRRMAPPGLSGPPPPPPEWINRSFDPFNGQDPSLIAARRLQHSQRMLEASGLFAGGGFGHPPVPRFGFSPDFNRGPSGFMPHQAPPPPPMGMFPPPPPPHPMMRHAPPLPEMLNMQSPFGPPPPQLQQQQQQHIEELRNEFNGMNMNGNDEPHQQSRDDLRALLPNVKISFNNLQEKRRAEEFYQQQLIMQRQQQMQQQQMQQQQMQQQQMQQMQQQQQHIQRQHQYQQEPKMSEQEQIPTRLDNSDHNITSSPSRHASFTETSSPLQSVQEKVLLKSPMNQQWQPNQFSEMVEKKNNPDVRVEAQNFFGEFLRKAASSTQQQEMSPKRDEPSLQPAAATSLPFQDPAIMSVRLVNNDMPNNDIVHSQNTILQILGGQPPPPPSSMMTLEQQQQMHQQQQFHQQQQQQQQQRQMDPRFAMEQQGRMMHQDRQFNDMAPKNFNAMFMGQHPPPPQQQQQQQQQQPLFHQQGPPPPSNFMSGFREAPPPMGMMNRMPPPPPGMMRSPMPPLGDMRFRNMNGQHPPPPPGMFSNTAPTNEDHP